MDTLASTAVVVLAFLGGLLALAAGNAINTVVGSRIGRADKTREQADTRSRQAAEVCYEELAKLLETIPELASLDRRTSGPSASDADHEALRRTRATHDASIASIEANAALFRHEVRTEMEELLEVLPYAYDLPFRSNPQGQLDQGWHPDSARTIAIALVRHARAVLASHLTNGPLPERTDAVNEYFIATDERSADIEEYFADQVEEGDGAIRAWRERHSLRQRGALSAQIDRRS